MYTEEYTDMDRTIQIFVLIYIILITIFTITTFGVVKDIKNILSREIEIREEYQQAPERCAKYYNNGTEEWINCIGVGYVN